MYYFTHKQALRVCILSETSYAIHIKYKYYRYNMIVYMYIIYTLHAYVCHLVYSNHINTETYISIHTPYTPGMQLDVI